ncbi:MAG: oxygenase MpaB family protein [Polyangiaceae bacterium]
MTSPPRRFVNLGEARSRFGPAIDRLGALMLVADPLGDDAVDALSKLPRARATELVEVAASRGIAAAGDAPEAVRALFAELERVPVWLDRDAMERGGRLLFRAGWFGGLALATSLLYGYASPAGNKPLVFSGRLEEQTARRLMETSRFVQATCLPRGLERGAPGYAITVKVRIMHAHVRRMLLRSERWSTEDWGIPANQHDMGATGLLFSALVVDTLTNFGFVFDAEEVHLYMQLWRYSGFLMGVHEEVLPGSLLEAKRLAEMIAATEEGPDEDSRRLSRALFASGENPARASETERRRALRMVKIGQGLIRGVVGDRLADELDIPRHGYRRVFEPMVAFVRAAERTRLRLPAPLQRAAEDAAIQSGLDYWDGLVRAARDPLDFPPPEALLGLGRRVAAEDTRRAGTLASFARPR